MMGIVIDVPGEWRDGSEDVDPPPDPEQVRDAVDLWDFIEPDGVQDNGLVLEEDRTEGLPVDDFGVLEDTDEPAGELGRLEREAGCLGMDLGELREDAKISADQLASQLHCPVSEICRIERGERLVDPDDVREWARAVGAPGDVADELLRRATHLQRGELAEQEMSALVEGTVKAFAEHALLSLHGVGLAVKVVEWGYRAWQWSQVGEGEGELEAGVPIPLGSGLELDLSVHPGDGGSDGQPPLTFCFAPSGGSSPGVLAFGPFEVSPDSDHAESAGSASEPGEPAPGPHQGRRHAPGRTGAPAKPTVERHRRAVVIRQDLSDALEVDGAQERVRRLHKWAESRLARVLEANSWLELTNAGVVVVWDPDTAVAVWVHLDPGHRPSWGVTIRPDLSDHESARIDVTIDGRRLKG